MWTRSWRKSPLKYLQMLIFINIIPNQLPILISNHKSFTRVLPGIKWIWTCFCCHLWSCEPDECPLRLGYPLLHNADPAGSGLWIWYSRGSCHAPYRGYETLPYRQKRDRVRWEPSFLYILLVTNILLYIMTRLTFKVIHFTWHAVPSAYRSFHFLSEKRAIK